MKERPILFSGEMVRAILAGHKTQTRRIVKPQPLDIVPIGGTFASAWNEKTAEAYEHFHCPYGQPGDRLWVRETFWFSEYSSPHPKPTKEAIGEGWGICYAATDDMSETNPLRPYPKTQERLRPSIFMPRWASRITLEITAVRVERLQYISEADAFKEGCEPKPAKECDIFKYTNGYKLLWDSINGHGSWYANPWVWVIEFRKI